MKKKKLSISGLKVKSFVTSLDKNEKATIAGGGQTLNPACNSQAANCQAGQSRNPFCPVYTCNDPRLDSFCAPPPDSDIC